MPDLVRKHVECHCEHVSFLIGKYPKMRMNAIVQHLDRLDNAKDSLEEDVAGILDDQSAAERDMAELRAEQVPVGGRPRDAAVTRTGEQAGKAPRSQGHQYARVM